MTGTLRQAYPEVTCIYRQPPSCLQTDLAEICDGDVGRTEGAETGELKEQTTFLTLLRGRRRLHAAIDELHTQALLLVLLANDTPSETFELALNDLYFFAYLESAEGDGYHILFGPGGLDECRHLTVWDNQGRVHSVTVFLKVIVVKGNQLVQLMDGLLLFPR